MLTLQVIKDFLNEKGCPDIDGRKLATFISSVLTSGGVYATSIKSQKVAADFSTYNAVLTRATGDSFTVDYSVAKLAAGLFEYTVKVAGPAIDGFSSSVIEAKPFETRVAPRKPIVVQEPAVTLPAVVPETDSELVVVDNSGNTIVIPEAPEPEAIVPQIVAAGKATYDANAVIVSEPVVVDVPTPSPTATVTFEFPTPDPTPLPVEVAKDEAPKAAKKPEKKKTKK